MKDIRYDILEHLGTLGEPVKGWAREVNMISWNDGPAKIDIRSWSEDRQKMSKGITLTQEEARELAELILQKCNF